VKTKRHAPQYNPQRINVVTLGCSKNLVDSEILLTHLHAAGRDVVHQEEDKTAGIVVVNTCGFIDRAKQESIDTILHYANRKKKGKIEKLYVTGCLSARYADDLAPEMPEVDGFFGNQDDLPRLLATLAVDYRHELVGERRTTTDSHYAYLKISEGCDRPCSFCAIPLMRGGHKSRSIDSLVTEANFLAAQGVQELMLIAQDSTYYGLDLYGERRLAALLQALATQTSVPWLRLHYAFPSGFPLDVLPVMRQHLSICRYLDMPLQHAADPVLRSMRRGITQAKMRELIARIRDEVPGIALRTTFLVGYPGETEADFDSLRQFVADIKFDRLGVFQYSHEDGTHAATLPDDVPDDVKQERADSLMELQQDISTELNSQRVGQTLRVLIDRLEGAYAVGRTEFDSPEVDNEVLIHLDKIADPTLRQTLRPGQFVQAHITDATEYDLFGEVKT